VHDCDALAMDTGEVWALPYDALLAACAVRPRLMAKLHRAMSREIARDRSSLMSVCTLPADARVADFLRDWAAVPGAAAACAPTRSCCA
jgi:CRP/FNR family transcriptional regulator